MSGVSCVAKNHTCSLVLQHFVLCFLLLLSISKEQWPDIVHINMQKKSVTAWLLQFSKI